ncbi:MAG: hypothetical protein ACE5HN_05570 [Nitrospiria bacterium]
MPFLPRLLLIFRPVAKGVFCLALVILLSPRLAAANAMQEEVPLTPEKVNHVYKEMLFHAQTRSIDAVARLLPVITPMTQYFKEEYGVDSADEIQRAIPQGYEAIVRAIQRLIYIDMGHHYKNSLNEIDASRETAREHLISAFRDYLLLSPTVQVDHFLIDQKIKNRFRRAVTATTDSNRLALLIEEMRRLLLEALPELK